MLPAPESPLEGPMTIRPDAPKTRLSVLFLCTHNSSRSQIAEAIMSAKAARVANGRYRVGSAGSHPGVQVHPGALQALRRYGITWTNGFPKSIDAVCDEPWDLIITVCDSAKETCPTMPGQPAFAHWGMDDPSESLPGPAQTKAFDDTYIVLARRIDVLFAIPFETLTRRALELRAQQIAADVPTARAVEAP